MQKISAAFAAFINGKEQPNHLYVHGTVWTYTSETIVEVKRAEVQGINEQVLLLDVLIQAKPGPMKGVPRQVTYQEEVDGRRYTDVQVRFVGDDVAGNEDQSIKVDYFG